jgi:hypothetical protein
LLHKAIEHMGMDTGKIWNLSAKAAGLMVDIARVHTYSGTYGVRKVGRTRHTTEGGRPGRHRRPLHEVMREDFEELVSAEDIRDCEIKIQKPLHGLVPGTAVVLNPAAGRCVFREMLGKDRISVFLDYLVK